MDEQTKGRLVMYYAVAVLMIGALCDLVIVMHSQTIYLR